MAQVFASQLTSIISEGVFDRFPSLRVALLEGGFTWLPALHVALRQGVAQPAPARPLGQARRRSHYIREHVRLTIQPLDAPPDAAAAAPGRRPARLGRHAALRLRLPAPHTLDARARRCWPTCRPGWPARSGPRTRAPSTGSTRRLVDPRGGDDDGRDAARSRAAGAGTKPAIDRLRLPQRARLGRRTSTPTCPKRWLEHVETFGTARPRRRHLPALHQHRRRTPGRPRAGEPAPTSPSRRAQLPRPVNVAYGDPDPARPAAAAQLNLELGAALATAVNDWQVAEWLDPEPRFRASIVVPFEDPTCAVAEIERRGRRQALRPGPVLRPPARADGPAQVLADLRGLRRARPGTSCRTPSARTASRSPAPAGRPSTSRTTSARPRRCRPTSSSMVVEGVFERFPTLNVVSVENGFGWLPSLCGGSTAPGACSRARCRT